MRPTSALQLSLLAITTASLAAPVPVPVGGCSGYASCGPSLRALSTQRSRSTDASALLEPHFPAHQIKLPKHPDIVEVTLLDHHVTTPTIPIKAKQPALDAVRQTAPGDEVVTKKTPHDHDHESSTESSDVAPEGRLPSANGPVVRKYGFSATMMQTVQMGGTAQGRKCGLTGATTKTRDRHGGRITTVTHTYGYSYIRKDYTSILVVGIVVIFILAVVLVELLDKVIQTTRAIFGLDEGLIKLRDCDCERSETCPPYESSPTAIQLKAALLPRSSRQQPIPRDVTDEKVYVLRVEDP